MKKCLLWGTGREFRIWELFANWKSDVQIVGVIETNPKETHVIWKQKPLQVLSPRKLGGGGEMTEYDAVIITNGYWHELRDNIKSGIEKEKIIVPYMTHGESKYEKIIQLMEYVENADEMINFISSMHSMRGLGMQPMTYDNQSYSLFNDWDLWREKFIYASKGDYVRIRTLELLAEEIKEKNIEGEMAEVGVFNGSFSQLMTHLLPDRELYLYDTFEGFMEKDYGEEVDSGNFTADWMQIFKTVRSLEWIKRRIGNEEKCHYRKGYFPDTVEPKEKEQKFCLVSLDADMYNPILAGLEFFYPRLSAGGYIMIHEYNARLLEGKDILNFAGVKAAVKDFERKHGHICCVPITDRNGTLVITK